MKFNLFSALTLAVVVVAAGCGGNRENDPTYMYNQAAAASNGGGAGGSTGGAAGTVGNFSAGPDLNGARGQHCATVLDDGRVLVTGGTDGQGIVPDSELFDPLANSWEIVRNLHPNNPNDGLMVNGQVVTARQLHSSTKMNGGAVLVAGGLGVERVDANNQPVFEALTTAFLFDPATNKFVKTGSMAAGRWYHGAGKVSSGQIVLTAGLDGNQISAATADVYDPNSGAWASVATQDHHAFGQVVSMASEAWVIGGCQIVPGQQGGMAIGGFPANRCEKFGAAPVAATPAAAILNDRMDMGVCVAKVSGLAVMAGGNELNGQSLDTTNTTEIYDPNANSWAAGPTLNIPRWATAVAEIGTTSDMLIVGGIDANNALMVTCEVMGMAQGAILGTVDMATARSDFPAVTLNDGRIMVIGGLDDQGAGLAQTEFHTR